jgi:hypothetical protein
MVYSVQNNVAMINGSAGVYDGKINNPSVKYGRNAVSNHFSYLNDLPKFTETGMPPLDFEYKYMPDNKLDKMVLLGAAFEEMGKKVSVSVQEMTEKLKQGFDALGISANALDINKDGKIDNAEYAATILVSDMSSENPNELDAENINGVINKTGLYIIGAYANEKNEANASANLSAIHNAFNLDQAQREFLADTNNTLD